MIRFYILLASILLFCGCHKHVQLQVPPPVSAPVEERIQAYQQLKPLIHREIYTVNGYGTSVYHSLTLANGIKVYHPEDLIPVVGSDTQFSQYALKSVKETSISNFLMGTGLGVELLGSGIMIAGIPSSLPGSNQSYAIFGIGAGLVIAGLVGVFTGYYFAGKAEDSASSAFDIYDQALLQRLDLKRRSQDTNLIPAH